MEIAGNEALAKDIEVERKGLGTLTTRAGIIENLIFIIHICIELLHHIY